MSDNAIITPLRGDAPTRKIKAVNRQTVTLRIAGIEFARKGVWVSEWSSMIFIGVMLAVVLHISQIVLSNEQQINELSVQIAALKIERVSVAHESEIMRERLRMRLLTRHEMGRRIAPETADRLADLVYESGKQFGYSPELLLGVMAVESMFDPGALGRYRSGALSGAYGIMQVKYDTALDVARVLGIRGLRQEDLFNPEMNMVLGTAYLTMLISQFKSFELGIMAYNLGPGTVRGLISRREQIPMRYYEKVLNHYFRLKTLGDELIERELAPAPAEGA